MLNSSTHCRHPNSATPLPPCHTPNNTGPRDRARTNSLQAAEPRQQHTPAATKVAHTPAPHAPTCTVPPPHQYNTYMVPPHHQYSTIRYQHLNHGTNCKQTIRYHHRTSTVGHPSISTVPSTPHQCGTSIHQQGTVVVVSWISTHCGYLHIVDICTIKSRGLHLAAPAPPRPAPPPRGYVSNV